MTSVPLADQAIPSVTALGDVYPEPVLPFQRDRYARVVKQFQDIYGEKPDFIARSPGRVNLIGEHIDYCGYSVLPMAIDRDVVIAVKVIPNNAPHPGTSTITLANTDAKFPSHKFIHSTSSIVDIDSSVHEWSNYFKCGYKSIFESLGTKEGVSFAALVDGTVPTGAGVSSSSAFVCCSALATLTALGKTMTRGELTMAAIKGEQYAGVRCGGMDQAISVMAPGSPLLIHFHPKLSAEEIAFPKASAAGGDAPVFVIANTLVVADKHVTAPTQYNLRVVETRLAAALLIKHLNGKLPTSGTDHIPTLRDVQDLFSGGVIAVAANNEATLLSSLLTLVDQAIDKQPYTREKIAKALDLTVPELESIYVGTITIRADTFALHSRATHVYSEARRVFQFRDVCASPTSKNLLRDLGALMNASQESCRDLYNCSCPEIDTLTSLALESGAYGSRLTGAGWGGCTVSLVAEKDVPSFVQKLKEGYYFKRWPEYRKKQAELEDIVFASRAGTGAAVLTSVEGLL
ncbi:ribosomal protein S5 domain 2-type protein [Phlyctochytrium arcticum]|nr:ribosomal protein S5 domain 2-type protein [Phlyctochytrium arcticum]